MHLVRWILALALLSVGAAGAHAQTLTVGTAEWRPWQIRDGHRLSGITPDILAEVARRTGIGMNLVLLPHRRLMEAFRAGEIDLEPAVSPLWREDQRDISVYTNPFCATSDVILVRAESGIRGTGPGDFAGLSLGCGLGYFYPEGFQEAFVRGDIVRDDNPAAGNNLKKLLHQRIDGAILDRRQADFLLKVFRMNPAAVAVAYEFPPSNLCLRLHPRRQDLLPALNAAIASMVADGTVARVLAGYSD